MNDTPEPKFEPKPGQVDFTDLRYCPTLNCVVRHEGKMLLLKRPDGMHLYPGIWGGVTGFLDDAKTLEEKAKEELAEETGLGSEDIITMHQGDVREIDAPEYEKVWISHPVLIDIKTDKIKLNWENAEARWIDPEELKNYNCTPGFPEMALALLAKF